MKAAAEMLPLFYFSFVNSITVLYAKKPSIAGSRHFANSISFASTMPPVRFR
jgi:hypothetical protein